MNLIDHFLAKLEQSEWGSGETGGLAENEAWQVTPTPPSTLKPRKTAESASIGNGDRIREHDVSANPPLSPDNTVIIESPLPIDREGFVSAGLDILPEDITALRSVLPRGTKSRNRLVREYISRWRAAVDQEPAVHRKQNAGRRAANSYVLQMKNQRRGINLNEVDLPDDFDKKEASHGRSW